MCNKVVTKHTTTPQTVSLHYVVKYKIEPMKVDMHKLPQTAIELSRITNKTCSYIQETL